LRSFAGQASSHVLFANNFDQHSFWSLPVEFAVEDGLPPFDSPLDPSVPARTIPFRIGRATLGARSECPERRAKRGVEWARTQIELAVGHGHRHLAPHDLAL